jgi:hypothetical protein
MADGIKIEGNFEELRERKKWLDAYIGKMVVRLVNVTSLALQKHIRQDLFQSFAMTGPRNSNVLFSRSKKLRNSVINIPAVKTGDDVKGGVGIGTKYARVHFGKRGQVTTIVAKGKMLTIPLPAAMDNNGVTRGSARDEAIFGETFIRKSAKGNLIIFGKLKYVKGKSAGKVKGKLVPLFLLRNQVNVPARIFPEDLAKFAQPLLGKGMADIKNGLMGAAFTE